MDTMLQLQQAIADVHKHLPGRHDQKLHGHEQDKRMKPSDFDTKLVEGHVTFSKDPVEWGWRLPSGDYMQVRAVHADAFRAAGFHYDVEDMDTAFAMAYENGWVRVQETSPRQIETRPDGREVIVNRGSVDIEVPESAKLSAYPVIKDYIEKTNIGIIHLTWQRSSGWASHINIPIYRKTWESDLAKAMQKLVGKHLPGKHDQKTHGQEMFHGTTASAARQILKSGLLVGKTKKDRTPGKVGVYATDKLDAAIEYGKLRASQAGKSEYGIIVLRGTPDEFNSEWGFGRFSKDVSPDRIMRIEIRRAGDDKIVQVLKSDIGDCYVGFIVDGDDIDYVEGLEVKHLPGRHDQKDHGRPGGWSTFDKSLDVVFVDRDILEQRLSRIFKGRSVPTLDSIAMAYTGGLDKLPKGTRLKVQIKDDSDSTSRAAIQIKGSLIYNGKRIGDFKRTLYRRGSSVEANHDEFFMTKDYQGTGYGSEYFYHSEHAYRSMGVDAIRLVANGKVGGYAWAKMGFEFVPESRSKWVVTTKGLIADDIIRKISSEFDAYVASSKLAGKKPRGFEQQLEYEDKQNSISDRLTAKLKKRIESFQYPYQLAAVTVRVPGGKDVRVGKQAMLGRRWSGVKYLTGKPSPAVRAGNRYRRLKKRLGYKK